MAKKTDVAVIASKSPLGGDLEAAVAKSADSALLAAAVVEFGVDPSLPADLLIGQAVSAINAAERMNMAAGVALLQAKEKCAYGEFEKYLTANGFETERAQEHMAVAAMLLKTKTEERSKLMRQGKTALIGLARMDDEVRQRWLSTGELDERLTLNEYRALLGKKDVALAAANNENQKLLHQVRAAELTGRKALDGSTPLAIGQLRREAASYAQDALACIHGFVDLADKLRCLHTDAKAAKWVAPVSLSLVSLLQGVRETCEQQLLMLVADFGLDKEIPDEAHLAMATPGPQEAQMIREAMRGVLIEFGRNHAVMEYEQYREKRKKTKTKGAFKKAPNAEAE